MYKGESLILSRSESADGCYIPHNILCFINIYILARSVTDECTLYLKV